jgi:hypothetical protein
MDDLKLAVVGIESVPCSISVVATNIRNKKDRKICQYNDELPEEGRRKIAETSCILHVHIGGLYTMEIDHHNASTVYKIFRDCFILIICTVVNYIDKQSFRLLFFSLFFSSLLAHVGACSRFGA